MRFGCTDDVCQPSVHAAGVRFAGEQTLALMSPLSSNPGRAPNSDLPTSWLISALNNPCPRCTFFPSAFPFASSSGRYSRMMSVPPGAVAVYAISLVSSVETVLYTISNEPPAMFVASAISCLVGSLRSKTCVAPRSCRREALCSDAIVTIGEKPERRANCMTAYTYERRRYQ